MGELELFEMTCPCGLTFKVSKGVKQVYHSAVCKEWHEDKKTKDYSRAWRKTNAHNIKEAVLRQGKKWRVED